LLYSSPMKTFVVGDIHGAHKALVECLGLARFDRSQDRLICLGDVCDRGAQVKECIDELLNIPHCVYILGNHDAWGLDWMTSGTILPEWKSQGGADTIRSYKKTGPLKAHIKFLSEAHLYYINANRLFVHAGFDPDILIEQTSKEILLWDRSFIKRAQEISTLDPAFKFKGYEEIYVGHTPTTNLGSKQPLKLGNVWAMDTGAGWGAKLTIMDIDTKQFWQSETKKHD